MIAILFVWLVGVGLTFASLAVHDLNVWVPLISVGVFIQIAAVVMFWKAQP
jgi:hypothetical protein